MTAVRAVNKIMYNGLIKFKLWVKITAVFSHAHFVKRRATAGSIEFVLPNLGLLQE